MSKFRLHAAARKRLHVSMRSEKVKLWARTEATRGPTIPSAKNLQKPSKEIQINSTSPTSLWSRPWLSPPKIPPGGYALPKCLRASVQRLDGDSNARNYPYPHCRSRGGRLESGGGHASRRSVADARRATRNAGIDRRAGPTDPR